MGSIIFIQKNIPIAWRIASSIVLASIVISCFATVALIYINYKQEDNQFYNESKKYNPVT